MTDPQRPTGSAPAGAGGSAGRGPFRPVSLAEILDELLWPHLLRAVPMALRPERLGVAILVLVATVLIGQSTTLMDNPDFAENRTTVQGKAVSPRQQNYALFLAAHLSGGLNRVAEGLIALDADRVRDAAESILNHSVPRAWQRFGWLSLALLVPICAVWSVGGCAISRMAACDFSQGVLVGLRDGLRFTRGRMGSLIIAVFLPLVLAGFVGLVIAAGGWLFLSWSAVSALGGVGYGLALVAAGLVVLLAACYIAGLPMMVPAVACEGADGIDAIQRAFAYVLGRPLRLAAYGLIALLTGWVTMVFFSYLGEATVAFAGWSSGLFLSPAALAAISADGDAPWAARFIRFWGQVPGVLVTAFGVSYFFTSSTILYLLLRQAHDGQDTSELWMPGMIEGSMARALHARAAAGGAQAGPATDRLRGADPEA